MRPKDAVKKYELRIIRLDLNNSRTGAIRQGLIELMLIRKAMWSSKPVVISICALMLVTGTRLSCAQTNGSINNDSKPAKAALLSQPMTIGWRYESNLTLNLTPAFDAERVYLPLAGGIIVSLKAASGQLNWRSDMGGELSASPVADDRGVYVASETGKAETGARRATGALRAVGREGGVTQWMRTLAMPLRGSLTLADGQLLAGSSDGKIYAFNRNNGEVRWTYDYGAPFNGQPVVSAFACLRRQRRR